METTEIPRCKYGHALTPENTNSNPHRRCVRCTRAYNRAVLLGINLEAYMEHEDAYDALPRFARKDPRFNRIDWSVPVFCRDCGAEMKPGAASKAEDPRARYGGDGRCTKCWYRARKV